MTSNEENKMAIQSFVASKKGKSLEKYLKESAWEEDVTGNTKVYLVKDRVTKKIVFFFALSAGLLYQELGETDYELTEQEKEIVELCVQYKLEPDNEYTCDEVFEWYEDTLFNKDKLRKIIQEKVDIKDAVKNDLSKTDKGVNIKHVSHIYPSIVLTHFCKNVQVEKYNNFTFPLGFYVFWEIIIDKVLTISDWLGCQYLYLFAADNSETMVETQSLYDILYDLDEAEIIPTYELVEYYKNELKFEEVQKLAILKPYYDFKCFSLYQPIHKLLSNRKIAWIQHSDLDEEMFV